MPPARKIAEDAAAIMQDLAQRGGDGGRVNEDRIEPPIGLLAEVTLPRPDDQKRHRWSPTGKGFQTSGGALELITFGIQISNTQCRIQGKGASMRIRTVLTCLLAAAALPASAQSFPDRPIRIIVPVNPGGGTDIFARKLVELIGSSFDQPIIVENRPGGSGTIGTQAVVDARPDGYTLGFVWNTPITAAPHTLGVRYTLDSYTPVVRVGYSPFAICAQPDFPASNLQELVAAIRAKPGQYSWGNEGMGGVMHLGVERVWHKLGLELTAVPFQGAGQTLPAFLGGHITFYGGSLTGAMPAVRADKAKCLMLTTREGSPHAPGSQGLEAIGLGDMAITIWWGLIAPRGIPEDRLQRLTTAFIAATRHPEFVKLMSEQAAVTDVETGEDFARSIRAEYEALGTVARQFNLLR